MGLENKMAYVVTEACIDNKHTSCVDVCPVDAFREGPDMLFIDPESCIDCNACVSECPERAIYPMSSVPASQQPFIALNAEKALVYPVITESINQQAARNENAQAHENCHVAIVGSGPSGFYAAEALLKKLPNAKVDIFEKLPTPFGLVRYGVAPDHPRIKSVTASFDRIAQLPQVRFFGNVAIGNDLSREQLLDNYHSVIYATGGSNSRALNIPGAELDNVFGSSEFVGWYNGHPDQAALPVNLKKQSAIVIGMGNVALDIARILVLSNEELANTDTADHALALFSNSEINEVTLIARRGPIDAAFTTKELEQLMAMPDLNLVVDGNDLELDAATQALLRQPEYFEAQQNILRLKEIAKRPSRPGKTIRFAFCLTPTSIEDTAEGSRILNTAINTITQNDKGQRTATASDKAQVFEAGLIVHAIGYQGAAIDTVPFNSKRGVIENSEGIVTHTAANAKEFAVGWIKRGASGVIGSNKQCATETVDQLIAELPAKLTSYSTDIESILQSNNTAYINFTEWQLLDQHEQRLAAESRRPRVKITDVDNMLSIIAQQKQQAIDDENQLASTPVKTHFRSCTLCEAMCGVKIEYQGEKILSIAGDPDDPHSEGHICPKGYALQDLHNDPDRLRTPLEKVDGEWLPIGWDEAFDKVASRLAGIQLEHGNDAVATYSGNPASHNLGIMMSSGALLKALATQHIFTAASLDQMPHQLVSYLMFGHSNLFTIPDIDRTDYMLMLGANPAASNGSLMTAGDILKRLESIQGRGGKVVLIDPRKTESARYMSEHHFIRPATDPLFLVGLIQQIIEKKLYKPDHLGQYMDNWSELLEQFGQFSLAEISEQCGIAEDTIIQIAEDFAAAKCAVCYGRMGISTQSFSALNHWLIMVLNILTGNLDRPGGMMFTTPAFNKILSRPMGSFASYSSRVRGLPEFDRQFPTAVMAEEMLTPGEGQIKGLVSIAGNPVLSSPNGRMMDQALEQLDFMVSIDFYLNETSRHADIILPPTGPLEHEQYDLVFNLLAVRNIAKFSEPLFKQKDYARSDWDIIQSLAKRIKANKNPDEPAQEKQEMDPEAILDFGLRTGPYAESFTEYNSGEPIVKEHGLSLSELKKYPHGLDLGPMQPNFPAYLFNKEQQIKVTPQPLIDDLARMVGHFKQQASNKTLMLIGRRDLRTNNSWMHNSYRLVKGKNRCALFMHPTDAAQKGLNDKQMTRVVSRVGEIKAELFITEDIMAGTVCLPHGWGHDREGVQLSIAAGNPGISVNDITDEKSVDQLSGNAILNGIPVEVLAIPA